MSARDDYPLLAAAGPITPDHNFRNQLIRALNEIDQLRLIAATLVPFLNDDFADEVGSPMRGLGQ